MDTIPLYIRIEHLFLELRISRLRVRVAPGAPNMAVNTLLTPTEWVKRALNN